MDTIPHPSLSKPKAKAINMVTDPLISAAKKAYRASRTAEVDALYAARARWSRKLTIARNKLEQVDTKIERLLVAMAKQADGPEAK